MKNSSILSACVLLALLAQGHAAENEGWSLSRLNPFGHEPSHTAIAKKTPEPSTLDKFNVGTKKFFTGAKDTLTFKKPAPKKTVATPYSPWQHKQRPEEKKSWFGSMFAPKEPKPIESLDDWMSLPRLDP